MLASKMLMPVKETLASAPNSWEILVLTSLKK
jgi:hypothetical protein